MQLLPRSARVTHRDHMLWSAKSCYEFKRIGLDVGGEAVIS